jgi:energy-converting hydrogenase Eha subunit C
MLWPLVPIVILGFVAIFMQRSPMSPALRFTVASGALVYFVVAAATTNVERAPYVFFAILAMGVLVKDVWDRRKGIQPPRS